MKLYQVVGSVGDVNGFEFSTFFPTEKEARKFRLENKGMVFHVDQIIIKAPIGKRLLSACLNHKDFVSGRKNIWTRRDLRKK